MLSGGEATAFTSTGAGYVCVDSEEIPPATVPQTLFPPLFQFDDVSQYGTIWNPGNDGTFGWNIGWNFNFMGTINNTMASNSNGFISFPAVGFANTQFNGPIPTAGATPNSSCYGFWDDLNPPVNSLRWAIIGTAPNRRYVFQWTAVPHIQGAGVVNATFSITIYEGGGANAILYQYLTMTGTNSNGLSATVGIENNIGSAGVQYLYGNDFTLSIPANNIYNGLAVGFYQTGSTPPWSSVLPAGSGGTPGGGGGGGAPPPTVDGGGDGEDDDRKHRRCSGDAGAGSAGAACLVTLAAVFALALARRAA